MSAFYRPYICRSDPETASWFITQETPYGREWWSKKRGRWLNTLDNPETSRASLFRTFEAAERELISVVKIFTL